MVRKIVKGQYLQSVNKVLKSKAKKANIRINADDKKRQPPERGCRRRRPAILKENLVQFNTRKHRNETVYYTVGFLEDAINLDRKVAFRYFDVIEAGRRVFRRDGAEYVMEPIVLVLNEDNYDRDIGKNKKGW